MPLRDGSSDAVISDNIAMLISEGKSPDQAAAIAYDHAGRGRKNIRWFSRIGGAIKAVNGKRRFEGYLVRFGRPDDQDLQREHFSKRTYFMRQAGYPVKGRPVNYQHGMVPTFGNLSIGLFDYENEDDIGVFVEAQLHDKEQYEAMLKELGRVKMVKMGPSQLGRKSELAVKAVDSLIQAIPLSQSMGADLATFKVDENTGHIDQCGIVHGALTPTPADDKNPQVQFKMDPQFGWVTQEEGNFLKTWNYVVSLENDSKTFVIGHPGPQSPAVITEAVTPAQEDTPKSVPTTPSATVPGQHLHTQETHPMWKSITKMSPEELDMLRSELMAAIEAVFGQMGMAPPDDAGMAAMTQEMEDKLEAKQGDPVEEVAAAAAADVVAEQEAGPVTEAQVADIVAENLEEILPDAVKRIIEQKRAVGNKRQQSAARALDGIVKRAPTQTQKSELGGYRQRQPEGINKQWSVIGRAEKPSLHSVMKNMVTGQKAQNPYIGSLGGYLVGEEISQDILGPLRAEVVAFDMGVKQTTVSGVGKYTVLKMTTAPTAYRPGINTAIEASDGQFDTITANPRPIAANVVVPIQLLMTTGTNVEQRLKDEVIKSLRLQIDLEIFLGVGAVNSDTGAEIKGIYRTLDDHATLSSTNIAALATNGRKPQYNDFITAEGQLNTNNVEMTQETGGWVMHPRSLTSLRSLVTTTGEPLFLENYGERYYASLIGRKVGLSTQIPITDTQGTSTAASKIICGDFSYGEYVMLNDIELRVDETTLLDYLQVRFIAYTFSDFIIHYPEAFYVMEGVTS